MADERIFKITINGLTESYESTTKLVDKLKELEKTEKSIAAEMNKLGNAINQSTRNIENRKSSIEETIEIEENLIETIGKTTDKIDKQGTVLEETNNQIKQNSIAVNETIKVQKESTNTIAAMEEQLKEWKEQLKNTDIDSTTFNQLSLQITGLEEKLANSQIGSLSAKQMSHVHSEIDKAATTVGNYATVLQGGAKILSIFGGENDKLAKQMEGLGQVMALVQTIQSMNNALLGKNGILTIAAADGEKQLAIATATRAATTTTATAATNTATIAQKAFNAVAKLNPYLLVITAIAAGIAVYSKLSEALDKATKGEKKFKSALDGTIHSSKEMVDSHNSHQKKIRDLDLEYKVLSGELTQYEADIQSIANSTQDSLDAQSQVIQEAQEEVEEYSIGILDIIKVFTTGIYGIYNLYNKIMGSIDASEKLEEENKKMKDMSERADKEAENYQNDKKRKHELSEQEFQEKMRINLLDGKEKELALLKIELDKQLKLHKDNQESIKAIQEVYAKDVQDVTNKYNKETTNKVKDAVEKRKQIIENAQNALRSAQERHYALLNQQRDLQIKAIENNEEREIETLKEELKRKNKLMDDDEKSLIKRAEKIKNSKLKEEQEEYQVLQDQLIIIADLRVKLEEKTATEIENIKKRNENDNEEKKLEKEKTLIQERLAAAKEGSEKYYAIKKEETQKIAEIEARSVKNSIKSEEEKAEEIIKINEQLSKDLQKIENEKKLKDVNTNKDKDLLDLIKKFEQKLITKEEYEAEVKQINLKALRDEIDIRKAMGEDVTNLETKYSEQSIAIAEGTSDERTKALEKLRVKVEDISKKITQATGAIFDAWGSVIDAQLEEANAKLEEVTVKYDEVVAKREESTTRLNDLEEEAKNASGGRFLILQDQINQEMIANQQLAAQEKELAKEKEKQEKEIAKKEKEQKKMELAQNIVQGLSNTALAITNAMLVTPFPLGVAMAAIAGSMGAVQVATMTKQLSKLEDGGMLNGKRHSDGGMRIEGTNIEVEGGEYVVNRQSTAKNLGLIRYINDERRELKSSDINTFFSQSSQGFEPPFRTMFEKGGKLPTVSTNANVNNEYLVDAIKTLKIEPKVAVTDINTVQENMVQVDSWTGL